MKAEHDDVRPEYDWSKAVRGKYANRATPGEQEERRSRAWPAMVEELSSYTLRQVQELESALFTFFVLAAHEPVQQAARRAVALLRGGEARPWDDRGVDLLAARMVDRDFIAGLREVAGQRDWIERPFPATGCDRDSLEPVLRRLETTYHQARALREQLGALIQQHLAADGMSRQEIERRTEETARLWLAA